MQFLLTNSNYMQKFALLTCQDSAQPVVLNSSDTEFWINFRFLTVLPLVQSLLCAPFELKMERSLFAHRGRKAVKCFLRKLLTIFKCYSIAVNLYCLQELRLKIRNECVGCVLRERGKGQLEKFSLLLFWGRVPHTPPHNLQQILHLLMIWISMESSTVWISTMRFNPVMPVLHLTFHGCSKD